MAKKRLMIHDFYQMKRQGQKITWVTSYDYPTAQFAEAAGLDMILVGDSLGMCVYGYPGTVPVTMDQCILHCDAVRRGAPNTFVIGDMPFLSYQVSDEKAVENAGRFLKEANVDAIKLEGGTRSAGRIRAIVEAGILVVGHIGLTPQSSGVTGRAQGAGPHGRRREARGRRRARGSERGGPDDPGRGRTAGGHPAHSPGALHPGSLDRRRPAL